MSIVSLTTLNNYNSLGNDINIVGTFSGAGNSTYSDVHISTPIVNYVEEYELSGIKKTLFYTEVNSNLNIGDRVFIINGNYDSSEFVKSKKYSKGSDGYKVLFIDKCKIVLDIDYTGVLPTEGDLGLELTSDYTRIYHVDSLDKFMTVNKQLTSRGGYIGSRFDYYQNNIAFIDFDYPKINDGWVRTAGVTASPGFYVREPAYDPLLLSGTKGELWTNITDDLMTGTFSLASSLNNTKSELRHYINGKILVAEGRFTYNGQDFSNGNIYVYDTSLNKWILDTNKSKVTKAILTKCNFRSGDFRGNMYSGLYGSMNERIKWTGSGVWLGGTLLNTSWVQGPMFSKILLNESYKTTLDRDRKPMQKLNTYNNGGYGFNYIFDSIFEKTSIYSAIVSNSRFGMTASLDVVESYIMGNPINYEHTLSNGLYESCEFTNTRLLGGAIKNSRSKNVMMEKVKHINSWSKDSVIKDSTIIADSIIKIDSYDEWSASEYRGSNTYGATFSDGLDLKVYKFYIGEADYLKLRSGDSFYIKGLTVLNEPELTNFFDKKFVLGSWVEYLDDFNDSGTMIGSTDINFFYKRGVKCAAFLTTSEENEWIYSSVSYEKVTNFGGNIGKSFNGFLTDTIIENPNKDKYSIDIFVSTSDINKNSISGLNFNSSTQSVSSLNYILPTQLVNNIDITNAYIIDSDIESGIIDNSNWNSGNNISYNQELTFTDNDNTLDILKYDVSFDTNTGNITIKTQANINNYLDYEIEIVDRNSKTYEYDIKVGDILFVSGLDYTTRGKITGFTISNPGSGYFTGTTPTAATLNYAKDSYYSDGYGATISFVDNNVSITDITITNPGLEYKVGDILYVNHPFMGSNKSNTDIDASVIVTSVDNTVTRLPDSWKVTQYQPPMITLSPLHGSEIIKGLTSGGVFLTIDARNRWHSFSRTKITNSKIKSGLFKRSVLINNDISNEYYDSEDKDFSNPFRVKSLLLSDISFSNTGNLLGPATYMNSSLVGGTDKWIDGIVYQSVLNKMNFTKGIVKQSSWLDGTFTGGLFYMSNSYNAEPLPGMEFYNINRIKSHWKGGITVGTVSNDRFSWRKGEFDGGEFVKSDWERGNFNNGLFYASKWYDGVVNGGIFGNETTATDETKFYSGTINFTTVNNASFVADDTSGLGVTNSIVWNNGIFNSGQFGSAENVYITNTNLSTYTAANIPNNGDYKFDNNKKIIISVPINNSGLVQLDKIEFKVNFSSSPALMVRNLTIYLSSPNGKSLLVKNINKGDGNEFKNTIFVTEDILDLSLGNSPYRGRFKVDDSNTFEFINSIDSSNIDGTWTIEISSSSIYALDPSIISSIVVNFDAEIILYPKIAITTTVINSSVWNNGTFNGGQFIDYGIWKDGTFNSGKFLSTWGWTQSGRYSVVGASESHTWQGGIFNGGEFGNSSTDANSTWYNGEFNNGTFNGRVWNNGIFRYGNFNGSGGKASGGKASGGWILDTIDSISNAKKFEDSYRTGSLFYGLWRDGIVTDANDVFIVDKKLYTEPERAKKKQDTDKTAIFNDMLWNNGTFDNADGEIKNSVWLNGVFNKGLFSSGSFNPWVYRINNNRDDFGNSVWNNGTFNGGDFYYSDWVNGSFINGTGIGMWFKDGTSYYMNAYNITWGTENTYPVWKNGNWYGSEFTYNGQITNPMHISILNNTNIRNNRLSDLGFGNGAMKIHIWNVFDEIVSGDTNVLGITASEIKTYLDKFVPTNTTQIFYPPIIWPSN